MSQGYAPHEVDSWLREMDQDGACLNQELFTRAWFEGYEVETEKRYLVKIKGDVQENILVYGYGVKRYFFSSYMYGNRRTYHTKDELTKGGFEWVFSCEGVEVEEVEE